MGTLRSAMAEQGWHEIHANMCTACHSTEHMIGCEGIQYHRAGQGSAPSEGGNSIGPAAVVVQVSAA